MKTARFATVVAKVGRPIPHLTWLPLEKDAVLKSALTANRVMTIHQTMRGGQKDFGSVGFVKGPQTQILIFPKSLRRFVEQRIVGINYDLVAEAPKLPATKSALQPSFPARRRPAPPLEKTTATHATSLHSLPPPAPPQPAKKVARAPVVVVFPLTWDAAAKELDQIRRILRGRPEAAARLAKLSARMKEKLAPH